MATKMDYRLFIAKVTGAIFLYDASKNNYERLLAKVRLYNAPISIKIFY